MMMVVGMNVHLRTCFQQQAKCEYIMLSPVQLTSTIVAEADLSNTHIEETAEHMLLLALSTEQQNKIKSCRREDRMCNTHDAVARPNTGTQVGLLMNRLNPTARRSTHVQHCGPRCRIEHMGDYSAG